jgi:hypothetical protein
MKDVLKNLKLCDVSSTGKSDLTAVYLKAQRIKRYFAEKSERYQCENNTERELPEYVAWRSIAETLKNAMLFYDDKTIRNLWVLICDVENFYNENAEIIEPDVTKDELNLQTAGGYLLDMDCKIQTMMKDGWKFGHNLEKKKMFLLSQAVTSMYMDMLKDGCESFPDCVLEKIKKMDQIVNEEFNKFWNVMHVKK